MPEGRTHPVGLSCSKREEDKASFIQRVASTCHILPGRVVEAGSLTVFKNCFDEYLNPLGRKVYGPSDYITMEGCVQFEC